MGGGREKASALKAERRRPQNVALRVGHVELDRVFPPLELSRRVEQATRQSKSNVPASILASPRQMIVLTGLELESIVDFGHPGIIVEDARDEVCFQTAQADRRLDACAQATIARDDIVKPGHAREKRDRLRASASGHELS